MRKLFLIAGCLAIAACGPVTALTTVADGIQTSSDTVVLSSTKALVIATDAYTAAALAATTAVKAGHFTDDQLRMIDTLNDRALQLIKGGDTALTVAQRAAGLSLIVTQLHSIIGR